MRIEGWRTNISWRNISKKLLIVIIVFYLKIIEFMCFREEENGTAREIK
jgi:hypothetical protein